MKKSDDLNPISQADGWVGKPRKRGKSWRGGGKMSNYFTAKFWVQKKIWSKRNLGQNIQKNCSNGANMTTQAGPVKSRWDWEVGENKDWKKKSECGQWGREREDDLCNQCQFCKHVMISLKFFFFPSRIGSAGRIIPARRSGSAKEASQKCSYYILYIIYSNCTFV